MKPRIFLVLVILLALAGCRPKPASNAESQAPVVSVSLPIRRDITDYIDYTGRTEAVNAVDIRARVTGYLVKMPFKEGDELEKGNLLFEIDPRPYQAQLDQAEANVKLTQAQLKLAKANNARAQVIAKTPGAISKQDLDQYQAAEEEAAAQVTASQASLESYQLNRDFCEIESPIDGKVSRYYYTLGNLISQDATLLTTIVSLDPIYVYLDIDDRTVLSVRNRINKGTLKAIRNPEEIKILMGLQGEKGFPHEGHVNFINNTVDPFTGTITFRAVYDNPKPKVGVRLLSPGMFVRVRIPLGEPHEALLVNDRAVGTDQSLKYLYVVDRETNKVESRRVTLGTLQDDGMRAIDEGLKPDDWVVVSGMQQIRPRMVVSPEEIAMPIPTAQAAAAAASAANQSGDQSGSATPSGAKKTKARPADDKPQGKPAAGPSRDDKPE